MNELVCALCLTPFGNVSHGGGIFSPHGHHNFAPIGGSADLQSTERYLMPYVAQPVVNAVWADRTAVIELIATKDGSDWNFEEILRSETEPESSTQVGELVVLMNWEEEADLSETAQATGAAYANYVLDHRPEWLSDFGPISTVGHSRGTMVSNGFIEDLARSNVTFDTATYLDFSGCCQDKNVTRNDNVVFAQTFRQDIDSAFHGKKIRGTADFPISSILPDLESPQAWEYHAIVIEVFADTVDREKPTDLLGGSTLDRDDLGGAYMHVGDRAHERPVEGLHPMFGGEAISER